MTKKKTLNLPSLTSDELKRLAQSAGTEKSRQIITECAKDGLTPAVYNRKVTDAHLEVIMVRAAAGETVKAICADLGISSGAVYQRCVYDPEWIDKINKARVIGAYSLFDMMREVAWNDDEPVERSKLKVAVLDRMARTFNRDLSDRIQHDVRQAVTYVLPRDSDDLC